MMIVRYLLIAGSSLLFATFLLTIGSAIAFDADDAEVGNCFFQVQSSPYFEVGATAAVCFSLSVILIITSIVIDSESKSGNNPNQHRSVDMVLFQDDDGDV